MIAKASSITFKVLILDIYQFLSFIILLTFANFILINQNCVLSRVNEVAQNNTTYL